MGVEEIQIFRVDLHGNGLSHLKFRIQWTETRKLNSSRAQKHGLGTMHKIRIRTLQSAPEDASHP